MPVSDGLSLLSFIYPRMQSFGTIEGFRLSMVNRDLLADFDACDSKTHPQNELMKVFLRIKPLNGIAGDLVYEPVLKCLNRYTVVACPPEHLKATLRDAKRTTHNFTFSQVFDSSTTQSAIFETVVLDQLRGFLEGLNGLIFAYGTTSSGKTYTMQGSINDFGMVPRALSLIFSAVRHAPNASLFPKDYSDIAFLNPIEVDKILKEKTTLLKLTGTLGEESQNWFDTQLNVTLENSKNLLAKPSEPNPDFTPLIPSADGIRTQYTSELRFTFWISFAEIYNELIFDLLDPSQCVSVTTMMQAQNGNRAGLQSGTQPKNMFSTTTQNSGAFCSNRLRKKPLELRTDKNGNIFIKGLRWYPITSPEEAFRLITVGKQCQKVAATRLNQASSRSHSILTIKAVRVVDKDNPRFARISSLTFCDLAGSERTEKAATGGQPMRIREAGNINTSLLTLGRCIECLRYNQAHPENPKLVPYRDSKLTRLFQGFFTGRGKACMIVNASPSPELFDETLHALRFSALAKQIVVKTNEIVETTIVNPSEKKNRDAEANGRKPTRPGIVFRRGNMANSGAVQRTPATVVPAKKIRHVVAASIPTPFSDGGDDDDDEVSTTIADDERPSRGADEDLPTKFEILASPHTPPAGDETGLILDDFSRDELMFMVKELSEQLFEAKGELVEQDTRLRQEMCDALNRQLVEFEQLYEESWNAQEKLMLEKSKRRLQYYDELANKRRTAEQAGVGKRCRFDDESQLSSEDDGEVSVDEYSSFNEANNVSGSNDRINSPSARALNNAVGISDSPNGTDLHVHTVPEISQAHLELREAHDRINELEGELADQRDAIENLSKERDRLQMETTRLEFTNSQMHKQLDAAIQAAEKAKPTCLTAAVQTDTPPVTPDDSCIPNNSLFDDSSIVIHLAKVKNTGNLKSGCQKFFDPYMSPEQHLRLAQVSSTSASPVLHTPQTVIKVPTQTAQPVPMSQTTLDQLRNENQMLLARLAQMRKCVQKAIEQKQETELELTRLQTLSTDSAADQTRMSEGLQSFLEHESHLKHLETMEQLRQQVYELEEQFAHKHDALLRSEVAYQQMKDVNDDLSQRVLAQADELRRLNEELTKCQKLHSAELEANQSKLMLANDQALCKLREEMTALLDVERQRVAALKSRIPDRDVGVQASLESVEPTVVDSSVQTASSPAPSPSSVALQLAQTDELRRLNEELLKCQKVHRAELEASQAKLMLANDQALCKLREEMNASLDVERQRVAALKSHIPDRDVGVQALLELVPTLVDSSVQTASSPTPSSSSVALQVSLQKSRHSTGFQTEPVSDPSNFHSLGSPILPVSPCPPTLRQPSGTQCSSTSVPVQAETAGEASESDQTMTAPSRSNPVTPYKAVRKLRLRRRGTKRGEAVGSTKSNRPPKLPSPVSSRLFASDDESDRSRLSHDDGKENEQPTEDEEDTKSCASEPVRRVASGKQCSAGSIIETGRMTRRTRSSSRKTHSSDADPGRQAPETRERKARSAAGTRRLPPLAESTQLMPDSFFQDELDHAVDQVYTDFQRRQDYPTAFKQPVARQQPRRQRR